MDGTIKKKTKTKLEVRQRSIRLNVFMIKSKLTIFTHSLEQFLFINILLNILFFKIQNEHRVAFW